MIHFVEVDARSAGRGMFSKEAQLSRQARHRTWGCLNSFSRYFHTRMHSVLLGYAMIEQDDRTYVYGDADTWMRDHSLSEWSGTGGPGFSETTIPSANLDLSSMPRESRSFETMRLLMPWLL